MSFEGEFTIHFNREIWVFRSSYVKLNSFGLHFSFFLVLGSTEKIEKPKNWCNSKFTFICKQNGITLSIIFVLF